MTDKHKQRAEEIADGYVSADDVSRTYYTAGLVASISLALSEAVAEQRERDAKVALTFGHNDCQADNHPDCDLAFSIAAKIRGEGGENNG